MVILSHVSVVGLPQIMVSFRSSLQLFGFRSLFLQILLGFFFWLMFLFFFCFCRGVNGEKERSVGAAEKKFKARRSTKSRNTLTTGVDVLKDKKKKRRGRKSKCKR